MPAPNIDTLYDFEGQFDAALKAILDPVICATYTPSTPLEEPKTPYIAAEFNQRSVAGPAGTALLRQIGADPTIYPECFMGQIVINLTTDRIKDQKVNVLRGKLRRIMSPQAQSFNATTLPWLQVLSLEEQNSARDVDTEHDTDVSALTWQVIYGIQPDAWPV